MELTEKFRLLWNFPTYDGEKYFRALIGENILGIDNTVISFCFSRIFRTFLCAVEKRIVIERQEKTLVCNDEAGMKW